MSFKKDDMLLFTKDIVCAHLSSNNLNTSEIDALIKQVYSSLSALDESENLKENNLQPAVPIDQSITDEYIICLEDGKKLKMLKRHLKASHDLTPNEYRKKWGLPSDYPMVAPNYARKRSNLAKEIGLGTMR